MAGKNGTDLSEIQTVRNGGTDGSSADHPHSHFELIHKVE